MRDVLVIPTCKINDRGKVLWLLLAAAYGLVNDNDKWKVLSDFLLIKI